MLIKNQKLIFFDLETTHLDPWRGSFITLACIVTDWRMRELRRKLFKKRPDKGTNWCFESQSYHGITFTEAINYPDNSDFNAEFFKFIPNNARWVCHAYPLRSRIDLFDRNFIYAYFFRNKRTDLYYKAIQERHLTSTITRKHKSGSKGTISRYNLQDQKLSSWAKKLKIELDHHEAMSDAEACMKIFKYRYEHESNFWDLESNDKHSLGDTRNDFALMVDFN